MGNAVFSSVFWCTTALGYPRRKTDPEPLEAEAEVRFYTLEDLLLPTPVTRRGSWHFRAKGNSLDANAMEEMLGVPVAAASGPEPDAG